MGRNGGGGGQPRVEVEADDRRLGWRPGGSRWGQTTVGGGDEEDE